MKKQKTASIQPTGTRHTSVRVIATATLVAIFMLLTGCDSEDERPHPIQHKHVENKAVVAHVDDFSKSTDQIDYFDATATGNLFTTLASSNGGIIKLIGVYENSARQNILSFQVDHLDTATSESEKNIYKIGQIRDENKRKLSVFNSKLQAQISQYVDATTKPHTEPFTDLMNALALARTTLNQPIFSKGYNKYLLLCSDCVNDPRGKRHAKLEPIQLPHTTILVVRPSLSETQLKELFPLSTVYTFTDVNDAIAMIK